jgi:hypothetical protein
LPGRCEHGARHEETYFEIIDGLNKEKPMLRHGAYVGFRPTADRRFARTDVDANYACH